MTNDPEAALRGAIRDPFVAGLPPLPDVMVWFEWLLEKCHGWRFDPDSIQYLHLASGWMQDFVLSISDDEDVDATSDPRIEHALVRQVFARRAVLAAYDDTAGLFNALQSVLKPDGSFDPQNFFRAHIKRAKDWHGHEVDSVYERVGSRLAQLVNKREAASGDHAKAIQAEIDAFLVEIGATRPQARPSYPPKDVLKRLFASGRALVDVCWRCLDTEPSAESADILSQHGAATPEEQRQWALRLALPVLSAVELRALQAEIESARNWGEKMGEQPTTRRFAVWILSHRLGLPAEAIANKVGTGDWDYFKETANPIQR